MTDEVLKAAEQAYEHYTTEGAHPMRGSFIDGYAACAEKMRAELEFDGIRIEPTNCKMCRSNLSRARELVEAERTRSAKLIRELKAMRETAARLSHTITNVIGDYEAEA